MNRIRQIPQYIQFHKKQVAAGIIVLGAIVLGLFIWGVGSRKNEAAQEDKLLQQEPTLTATQKEELTSSTEAVTSTDQDTESTTTEKKTQEKTSTEQKTQGTSATEPASPQQTAQTTTQEPDTGRTEGQKGIAKLKVSGTQLVNSKGRAVQLKGISTHGIGWFPEYINADCFAQLHDEFGVNVIRLAMYTEEYNGYCAGGNQGELKELIHRGVKYATANNMYVIIDWHILSDGNPNTHLAEAKQFFNEMSLRYASSDNILYEICNEPNGGTTWEDIRRYALEVIPVIRKNDPDSIIIVGTPNWSQYVDQAAAKPITEYKNIMYSLHFYAATHTDSLRSTLKNALERRLPMFVTEFGICDASGGGAIDENQAAQWISLLDSNKISYVMWNLSNKNETCAVLKSSCSKNSGFGTEDLTDTGKWFLKLMTGKLRLPVSSPDPTTKKATTASEQNQTETTQKASSRTKKVSAQAVQVNSWEADGRIYYQYDITVTNTSGSACDSWTAELTFDHSFHLSECWNADMSVRGKKLRMTPADYNRALEAGASTGNIGCIVYSERELKVK